MAGKNFLLLSLEDKKTRKIANIVSNDSCKKILDYLSENEATESELAAKLKIPISTIHYNLQQLMETRLIKTEEYHYSEKGREVYHYKLANKYIIITPKKNFGIRERLKGILPVALISAGMAGILQLTSNYFSKTMPVQGLMASKSMAEEGMATGPMAAEKAVALLPSSIAVWFLVGAVFALAAYLIFSFKKDSEL